MLKEWLRYHSKLGFHIFVYDRDSANIDTIHDAIHTIDDKNANGNKRSKKDGMHQQISGNIHYYNYTIRGLLDPKSKGLKYDNTELAAELGKDAAYDRNRRFQMQGELCSYIYVCVYVYMCIYVYVCMCICVYVCKRVSGV